jgi:hypothetical protein
VSAREFVKMGVSLGLEKEILAEGSKGRAGYVITITLE